jgi:hypothetical protein
MKPLLLAVLLGFSMGARAQAVPIQAIQPDVRAPVNVAISLYEGCLLAKLGVERPFTDAELKDPKGLNVYATSVDTVCVDWVAIWLGPLTGDEAGDWGPEKLKRFDTVRMSLLQQYVKLLLPRKP